MALVARCGRCGKKIRLDDAFAGGVWRCPECRGLNQAPAGRNAGTVPRPDAPPQRRSARAGDQQGRAARTSGRGRRTVRLVAAVGFGLLAAAGAALAVWGLVR